MNDIPFSSNTISDMPRFSHANQSQTWRLDINIIVATKPIGLYLKGYAMLDKNKQFASPGAAKSSADSTQKPALVRRNRRSFLSYMRLPLDRKSARTRLSRDTDSVGSSTYLRYPGSTTLQYTWCIEVN